MTTKPTFHIEFSINMILLTDGTCNTRVTQFIHLMEIRQPDIEAYIAHPSNINSCNNCVQVCLDNLNSLFFSLKLFCSYKYTSHWVYNNYDYRELSCLISFGSAKLFGKGRERKIQNENV